MTNCNKCLHRKDCIDDANYKAAERCRQYVPAALKAYRTNAARLRDIDDELSDKFVADSVSVCTPPSYTPHSTRIEGYFPSGDTLSLLAEKARLTAAQRAVEDFIDGIEDYTLRKMFLLRFVKGMTWIQLAHKVGSTADGCRMAVKRYLQKN